jgi:hypothetical protein
MAWYSVPTRVTVGIHPAPTCHLVADGGVTMAPIVSLTVFFLDGTKATFHYPRQAGYDPATILSNVKRAIDADRVLLEVDGDLLVIPMKSVKYIQVSPAPTRLPSGVLRNARLE